MGDAYGCGIVEKMSRAELAAQSPDDDIEAAPKTSLRDDEENGNETNL